jgi:hypothetical protein
MRAIVEYLRLSRDVADAMMRAAGRQGGCVAGMLGSALMRRLGRGDPPFSKPSTNPLY